MMQDEIMQRKLCLISSVPLFLILYSLFLSTPISAGWDIDTTPPTCTISFSPTSPQIIGTSVTATVSISETSSAALTASGGTLSPSPCTLASGTSLACTWDAPATATFTGTVTDTAGNAGSCTNTFTATVAPTVAPTATNTPTPTPLPPSNPTVSPLTCSPTPTYVVFINWLATDNIQWVDISNVGNDTSYSHKDVSSSYNEYFPDTGYRYTEAPTDFGVYVNPGVSTFNTGTTYYARVSNDNAVNKNSGWTSFSRSLCPTPTPTPPPAWMRVVGGDVHSNK